MLGQIHIKSQMYGGEWFMFNNLNFLNQVLKLWYIYCVYFDIFWWIFPHRTSRHHRDLLFYSFHHCLSKSNIVSLHCWLLIILSLLVAFCSNRDPVSCVELDFIAYTGCPHKQSLYVLHLWVTRACWGSKVWGRSIIVTQVGSLITLLWTPEKSQAFI